MPNRSAKLLEDSDLKYWKPLRKRWIGCSKRMSPRSQEATSHKKPDSSYRFCIDHRDLNKVTEEYVYPMKNVDTILDKLRKAKYTSKIDLEQAFMQIFVAEASRKYTAFSVFR